MSTTYSPQEIADRYGVDRLKVLRWINGGHLAAVNVATKPNGRPRWRVPAEALEDFERRRANPAAAPTQRRKAATVERRFYK